MTIIEKPIASEVAAELERLADAIEHGQHNGYDQVVIAEYLRAHAAAIQACTQQTRMLMLGDSEALGGQNNRIDAVNQERARILTILCPNPESLDEMDRRLRDTEKDRMRAEGQRGATPAFNAKGATVKWTKP